MTREPYPSTVAGGLIFEEGQAFVPHHGDAHDPVAGDDPVLGQIRFLGAISSSSTQNITTATPTDLTGMTLNIQSHGGYLKIEMFGERLGTNDGTTPAVNIFTSALLDGTALVDDRLDYFLGDANAAWQLASGATLTWWTYANPGRHTVKLQGYTGGTHVTMSIPSSGRTITMIITEILPAASA